MRRAFQKPPAWLSINVVRWAVVLANPMSCNLPRLLEKKCRNDSCHYALDRSSEHPHFRPNGVVRIQGTGHGLKSAGLRNRHHKQARPWCSIKTRSRYHTMPGPGRIQRSLHLVVGTRAHHRVQVSVTIDGPLNTSLTIILRASKASSETTVRG